MNQGDENSASVDPTAELQGESLLASLKADHWFWNWGNDSLWKEWEIPEGMVAPDRFMNVETTEIKTFLEELRRDGMVLVPSSADPDQLLMDRVKFMEWLILRYLKHTPTYSAADLHAHATEEVENARYDWEVEHGLQP